MEQKIKEKIKQLEYKQNKAKELELKKKISENKKSIMYQLNRIIYHCRNELDYDKICADDGRTLVLAQKFSQFFGELQYF